MPPYDSEYPGYLRVLYLIQQGTQSSTPKTSKMGYLLTEAMTCQADRIGSASGGSAGGFSCVVLTCMLSMSLVMHQYESASTICVTIHSVPPRAGGQVPVRRRAHTNGYSSTYLAMGFANVRAGTRYPPEH